MATQKARKSCKNLSVILSSASPGSSKELDVIINSRIYLSKIRIKTKKEPITEFLLISIV